MKNTEGSVSKLLHKLEELSSYRDLDAEFFYNFSAKVAGDRQSPELSDTSI